MIKIENVETMGWEAAIRGMRNPLNSWDKSDSDCNGCMKNEDKRDCECCNIYIGKNDYDLMKRLRNAGTDHRKFMRMITVYMDITAPLYWWKEFDTYKVGTVANSCSTMHTIHKKPFTLDDFSHEHLLGAMFIGDNDAPLIDCGDFHLYSPIGVLDITIKMLNKCREKYLETKDKKYWWQMIQLLPSSYNQKRTVMFTYEVGANMHKSRKTHKLDCWHVFCDVLEELPYSELITGKFDKNKGENN